MSDPAEILYTPRLRLVPLTLALAGADAGDPAAFGAALGIDVVGAWQPEYFDSVVTRKAVDALRDPDEAAWPFYYVVADLGTGPVLAGVVGYKGRRSATGSVEIGYAIRADLQGRGLATEAAAALVQRAFADPCVQCVVAETLPQLLGSVRVLEKLGFAPVPSAAGGDVLRFELRRDQLREPVAAAAGGHRRTAPTGA